MNIEQWSGALQRYCLSLTQSQWDADDLFQDTWEKAACSNPSMNHTHLEAWLMRIAKNTWIDHCRRQNLLHQIQQRTEVHTVMPDYGIVHVEPVFQALMKHLSPLQRAVFLLREVFGYSIEETASYLRTSKGAVKAALHRARQSMHAVREDLVLDSIHSPQDEGMMDYVQAMAVAYLRGDITTLVELARSGDIEPAAVMGVISNKLYQKSQASTTIPAFTQITSMMCAA